MAPACWAGCHRPIAAQLRFRVSAGSSAAVERLQRALAGYPLHAKRTGWFTDQYLVSGTTAAMAWGEGRFIQWLDQLMLMGRDTNCRLRYCALNDVRSQASGRADGTWASDAGPLTTEDPDLPQSARGALLISTVFLLIGFAFFQALDDSFVAIAPAPVAVLAWEVACVLVSLVVPAVWWRRELATYVRFRVHTLGAQQIVALPLVLLYVVVVPLVAPLGWLAAVGWAVEKFM